ncbi:hypothetical protein FACS1894126_2130 [Alphaproteobacteria bacterium]|nr:hypothetical protein FACS1894126_2130 [Alphaproteobacteria bacterium]
MNSELVGSSSRIIRITLALFLTIGVFFTAIIADNIKSTGKTITKERKYTAIELYKEIDNLSDTPVVIMAFLDDGPKLLHYTKHSVVGAPYHRQQQGIISSHKVMSGVFSEKTVGQILLDTNVSYIFIKKTHYKYNKARGSLADLIAHNINIPSWISIVKLPEKFDDIIIAKVNREMIKKNLSASCAIDYFGFCYLVVFK